MSDSDPVSIYHSLTHLTPNEVQVKLIRSKVTNRYLWKITLEHWLWHNWNLRNIPGLLDLYSRNGDLGCRSCHKPPPSTRNVRV